MKGGGGGAGRACGEGGDGAAHGGAAELVKLPLYAWVRQRVRVQRQQLKLQADHLRPNPRPH